MGTWPLRSRQSPTNTSTKFHCDDAINSVERTSAERSAGWQASVVGGSTFRLCCCVEVCWFDAHWIAFIVGCARSHRTSVSRSSGCHGNSGHSQLSCHCAHGSFSSCREHDTTAAVTIQGAHHRRRDSSLGDDNARNSSDRQAQNGAHNETTRDAACCSDALLKISLCSMEARVVYV
jgi:hypothetical protein